MAINFEEIPSVIDICPQTLPTKRTVLEELNARQYLLKERSIRCRDIRPLFERRKKKPYHYTYKYFCHCPRYNPQYKCKHSGNIIIDRDVLSQEEHIVYLATPKPNFAAPRKMPRYYLKKTILSNCTARINRLAKPDLKLVSYTLKNYQHVISRRHKRSLTKRLEQKPEVEYTSIQKALDWLAEEKRLKRVAQRKQRLRCQKLKRKCVQRQKQEIKKIIFVLFKEMKQFLLNDQFIMDESSSLVTVILETLREFTDKDFYITSNLREYQKILSFNLAVWINKFISNLNIQIAEPINNQDGQQYKTQVKLERPTQELSSFLPVGDYISQTSDGSEESYYEEEAEDYYSYHPTTSDKGQHYETTDI